MNVDKKERADYIYECAKVLVQGKDVWYDSYHLKWVPNKLKTNSCDKCKMFDDCDLDMMDLCACCLRITHQDGYLERVKDD